MIQTSRRGFITGLISFAVTAPAIVKASSLMPVKAIEPELFIFRIRTSLPQATWRRINESSLDLSIDWPKFNQAMALIDNSGPGPTLADIVRKVAK